MQDQLKQFISIARSKNVSDEDIVKALLEQGWKLEQVQPLISNSKNVGGLIPPRPTEVAANSLGMWDTFQHVLLFISLYVLSMSIALILHYLIDKWLPGVSTNSYNYYRSYDTTLISMYSSSLLVSFPFFAFFFLQTRRRKMNFPEIVNLRSRKILIYFTLIITFIIMVGHLIIVVFQFFSGNVTINALLHFFVTILVSGSIFGYYLYDIRHDREIHS